MAVLTAPNPAALVRMARAAADLTQTALASRTPLSVGRISDIETEQGPAPDTRELDAIATACAVEIQMTFGAPPGAVPDPDRVEMLVRDADLDNIEQDAAAGRALIVDIQLRRLCGAATAMAKRTTLGTLRGWLVLSLPDLVAAVQALRRTP